MSDVDATTSRDAAQAAIRAAQNTDLTSFGAEAAATLALATALVYLGDVAATTARAQSTEI